MLLTVILRHHCLQAALLEGPPRPDRHARPGLCLASSKHRTLGCGRITLGQQPRHH